MNRSAISGAVMALSAVSAIIFLVVGIHEFAYDSAHPYAAGPSLEIAWGGIAGALISVAVGLLAVLSRPLP
jgi:hypothetical protein